MDINILGPFQMRGREGREIRLPEGRERSLLVLLLIHRDAVVSTDRIVDALWGAHPPGTATKAVQGYVSHLRRVLEAEHESGDARSLLVTQAPGYALRTDAVAVDATRFERLAADGRRALEDGSAAEAALLLDEALALWRGQPLAEFAFDDFARDEIRRLDESRLSATEDRIDALLRLGRHGELAGELDSLVAAHPLRERLRGQWMLALYRSGRQADALQAYRDGRRLLDSELGLEPGPELQRLERAILAQDPELEAVPPVSPPRPADAAREQPPPRSRPGIHREGAENRNYRDEQGDGSAHALAPGLLRGHSPSPIGSLELPRKPRPAAK
jgi:DNA-binding SARP family transcriptional activator